MFQSDIIEKCRRNDRKAQLQLYNKYCNGMYSVAKRYLRHDAEAEDAVQDAFIKAFTKLHLFSGEVTFGAWLKRIVINTCIDCIKKKKETLIDLSEVHLKVVDVPKDEAWLIDDSISLETIKNIIETLPEKYRFVVSLYLIEGYDHQEISEILDITESTSRSNLFRGKQKLQKQLKTKIHATRY